MESSFDQDFNRKFMISVAVHAALIGLCLMGGKAIEKIFRSNDVEIIRSAIRVDVVGMPKFTVQELKDLQKDANVPVEPEVAKGEVEETKPEAEDQIKKDDLVIEEVTKKKKASFLNILSDYSAKKVTTAPKKKGEKAGKGNKHLDSLIVEGNRLSKGSSLVGDYSDEEITEFSAYVQTLPELVRQHWRLPDFLMKKTELRCRIRIYISGTGDVLKVEMLQPSGEEEFDVRAIKAIKDASPFPKPSEKVGARLTNSGIILGFPL